MLEVSKSLSQNEARRLQKGFELPPGLQDTIIGVRGMPERDIGSLGVMGWGLEAARKFFWRHPRRRRF